MLQMMCLELICLKFLHFVFYKKGTKLYTEVHMKKLLHEYKDTVQTNMSGEKGEGSLFRRHEGTVFNTLQRIRIQREIFME